MANRQELLSHRPYTFQDVRNTVSALSDEARSELFYHDIMNDFTILAGYRDIIEIENSETSFQALPSDLHERLNCLAQVTEDISAFLKKSLQSKSLPSFIEKNTRVIGTYIAVSPSLLASAQFLANPGNETYQPLVTQKVSLYDIAFVTGLDVHLILEDIQLPWIDGVILFNAAKNAKRYGSCMADGVEISTARGHLQKENGEGTIYITNKAEKEPPANRRRVGVKGENGNTGSGMAIMEMYSLLQGRNLQEWYTKSSSSDPNELMPYTFFVAVPLPEETAQTNS